jgi:sugar/nucleoside kinase (ribokinase family)
MSAQPTPRRGLFVGLCALDSVYRVPQTPTRNEKVVATRHHVAAGGPATNAAVTFAALGGGCTLLTAIGRHPLAQWMRSEVGALSVRVVDATPGRREPPAMSTVYVDGATGERSIVSLNATGSTASRPPELAHLVADADVVLADGHHPALCRAVAIEARSRGVPVVLDGGNWKAGMEDLLPHVDVAACSADFRMPGTSTLSESVAALRARGVPAVAVTRGAEPVLWFSQHDAGEVSVPAVEAQDTLGAGDAFHGALAWALGDRDLPAAIDFAVHIASFRVTVPGPRAWLANGVLRRFADDLSDRQRATLATSPDA